MSRYIRTVLMQEKLKTARVECEKVSRGYRSKPNEPTKKRKDTMLVKEKNGNLSYWWNLPIDELEEMADEDGKIKTEKMTEIETNKLVIIS